MNRVVAGVIGLVAGAAVLAGCSDDRGSAPSASGAIGGQQGLGIVGSAEVKVDGSTYTITGEASGADMANPIAGMISKPFTVTVTCN
jgi:ipoprotein LpqH